MWLLEYFTQHFILKIVKSIEKWEERYNGYLYPFRID